MSAQGTHTAFFYGTLLHPSILRRVIGHSGADLEICPALLLEHTRHKVQHADYPGVIPYEKSRQLVGKELLPEDRTVRGTLVRGLSDNDVRLLDTFEGDEYVRATVPVHPLGPFSALESAARDMAIVPTTPPPLSPEFVAGLQATHPALQANTYLWIQPISELKPDIWDYAEFVRDNAWKWVGASPAAQENEYYLEVDRRREMDGQIVRHGIVSVDEDQDKRVVVEVSDG
ncbi:gamma-glutamylcyclotransferase [Phanerochaete sordida]|uniref:Putative gamma-glutamylcyclotransferase n=1 Tax=Phanerochaete sordida TaxID=48140 RepID=A0A9P3LC08_9APHY|nr:gamma-glutamylcyclotransferase [Phanerochaete sordida]